MNHSIAYLTELVSSSWSEHIGWTLLHSLWQIAIVAVLYAVASFLLRNRSATSRYLVGCIAMIAMLLLPVITYSLLPRVVEQSPLKAAPTTALLPTSDAPLPVWDDLPKGTSVGPAEFAPLPLEPAHVTPQVAPQQVASWSMNVSSAIRPWLPVITTFWLMGVLLLSLRPIAGWQHVRKLQRHGLSPLTDSVRVACGQLMPRLGIQRAVQFAQSALVEAPTVVGYLRPIVLLPASTITGLTTAELELILAHELAHIRRHDYLVNLAQTVIEALLFYHPGMWWVSSQVRRERENCCDDIAVNMSGDRATYVRALAQLEQHRTAVPAIAATGGSLLERVRRLLGHPPTEFGYRNATAWLAGVVAMALVFAVLATGGDALGESKEPADEPAKSISEVEDSADDPKLDKFGPAVGREVAKVIRNANLPFIDEARLTEIEDDFAHYVDVHLQTQAFTDAEILTDKQRELILTAIKQHGAEHLWIDQFQPDNLRSVNLAYLRLPDRLLTLKWKLSQAIRFSAQLDAAQQAKLDSQRLWMETHIKTLPEYQSYTVEQALTELDERFADPLCCTLGYPMTDKQFQEFQQQLHYYYPEAARTNSNHKEIIHIVSHIVQASFAVRFANPIEMSLPFNDRVYTHGVGRFVHLGFTSNRAFASSSRNLSDVEASATVIDASTDYLITAPKDLREPDKFQRWLVGNGKGDFGFDGAKGGGLFAVRGAKLARLSAKTWVEADAISNADLRKQIEATDDRVVSLQQDYIKHRDTGDAPVCYVGVLTKEGVLSVVAVEDFSDRSNITIRTRVRPKQEPLSKMTATTLVDEEVAITFDRPSDWIVNEMVIPGNGPTIGFRPPGFSLNSTTPSLKFSIENVHAEANVDVRQPNPDAITTQDFKVDGQSAHLAVFKLTDIRLTTGHLTVDFAKGTRFYRLTMVYPYEQHERYLNLALAICKSVRLHRTPSISWGDAVDGLRLGIEVPANQIWSSDSKLRYKLWIKNDSDQPQVVTDSVPLAGWYPDLRSEGGNRVHAIWPPIDMPVQIRTRTLAAGEVAEIGQLSIDLPSDLGPGRYTCNQPYRVRCDDNKVELKGPFFPVEVGPKSDSAASLPKGLEFLAGIPEFADLRLDMTEEQLKQIIARHELDVQISRNDEENTSSYTLRTISGKTVIVMFGDGKCGGIQRMRDQLAWGEEVGDVVLALSQKPSTVWTTEAPPRLTLNIVQQGRHHLLLSTVHMPESRLKIDGVLYRHPGENITGVAYHPSFLRVDQADGIGPTIVLDDQWQSVEGDQPLNLIAGKHRVSYGWAGYHPDKNDPNEPNKDRPVLLWSGEIEVSVSEGKLTNELELGVGLLGAPPNRKWHAGSKLTYQLWIKNDSSKAQATINYLTALAHPLILHDSEGEVVSLMPSAVEAPIKVKVRHRILGAGEIEPVGYFSVDLPDSLEPGEYTLSQKYGLESNAQAMFLEAKVPLEIESKDAEDNITWGEAIDGLQAGLATTSSENSYQIGQDVPLRFLVRNTSDKPITFTHQRAPVFINWDNYRNTPGTQLFAPSGQVFPASGVGGKGMPGEVARTIQPGQVISMATVRLPLRPEGWEGTTVNVLTYCVKPGKHRVALSHTINGKTVISGMLSLDVRPGDQSVPPLGAPWGEANEGLRCRLHANEAVIEQGEPLILLVDLQNRGSKTVEQMWNALEFKLEIDGKWTGRLSPFEASGPVNPLKPGQEWINVPLVLQEGHYWMAETATVPGGEANFSKLLGPGRHRIRVDVDEVVSQPIEIQITAGRTEDKPQQASNQLVGRWVGGGGIVPVIHTFSADGKYMQQVDMPGEKTRHGTWRIEGEELVRQIEGEQRKLRITWKNPDVFFIREDNGNSWGHNRIDEQTGKVRLWGDAINGTSLRLTPLLQQWKQSDDSPVFELSWSNHGDTVDRADSLGGAILEIDGQEYLVKHTSWEYRANRRIPSDTVLEPFARFRFSWKHELVDLLDDGKGGFTVRGLYSLKPYDSKTSRVKPEEFQLRPGKHTLRVALATEKNLTGRLVYSNSNPVQIEIVASNTFRIGSEYKVSGTIRGKLTDTTRPCTVLLEHESWQDRLGELPNVVVSPGETFEFTNVPVGKCKVVVQPVYAAHESPEQSPRAIEVDVEHQQTVDMLFPDDEWELVTSKAKTVEDSRDPFVGLYRGELGAGRKVTWRIIKQDGDYYWQENPHAKRFREHAILRKVNGSLVGEDSVERFRFTPDQEAGGLIFEMWNRRTGESQGKVELQRVDEAVGTDKRSKTIDFHGLKLERLPGTSDSSKLPLLWQEVPPGSKSYEMLDDVEVVYQGFDGAVFYRPDKNLFYVQSNPPGSSRLTYYGPFDGNPLNVLDLPDEGITDIGRRLAAGKRLRVGGDHQKAGTIRGEVIGDDGPYRVTLDYEANITGVLPQLVVNSGETFAFTNVPVGECTITATPSLVINRGTYEQAILIKEVTVGDGQTVEAIFGDPNHNTIPGLSARLRLVSTEEPVRIGDLLQYELVVKNETDESIEFDWITGSMWQPIVDRQARHIKLMGLFAGSGRVEQQHVVVPSGREQMLHLIRHQVRAKDSAAGGLPIPLLIDAGEYQVTAAGVWGSTPPMQLAIHPAARLQFRMQMPEGAKPREDQADRVTWTNSDGQEEALTLYKDVFLDEDDVQIATLTSDGDRFTIGLNFTEQGSQKLQAVTEPAIAGQRRLVILLNGKVIAAPVVKAVISTKASITGLDQARAQSLYQSILTALPRRLSEKNTPVLRTVQLVISKDRGGLVSPGGISYVLDNELIMLDKLQERLKVELKESPKLRFVIHADPKLPDSTVEVAMQLAKAAGVQDVRPATTNETSLPLAPIVADLLTNLDGGTLSFKLQRPGQKPVELCFDGRDLPPTEKPSWQVAGNQTLGRLFVGANYPTKPAARLIELGSEEELRLLHDLNRWINEKLSAKVQNQILAPTHSSRFFKRLSEQTGIDADELRGLSALLRAVRQYERVFVQSHGVNVQLLGDPQYQWQPGDMPAYQVSAINQGEKDKLILGRTDQAFELEVDGKWYRQTRVRFKSSPLPPGRIYEPFPLTLDDRWQHKGEPLKLSPGKHAIRVRCSVHPFPSNVRDFWVYSNTMPVWVAAEANEATTGAVAQPDHDQLVLDLQNACREHLRTMPDSYRLSALAKSIDHERLQLVNAMWCEDKAIAFLAVGGDEQAAPGAVNAELLWHCRLQRQDGQWQVSHAQTTGSIAEYDRLRVDFGKQHPEASGLGREFPQPIVKAMLKTANPDYHKLLGKWNIASIETTGDLAGTQIMDITADSKSGDPFTIAAFQTTFGQIYAPGMDRNHVVRLLGGVPDLNPEASPKQIRFGSWGGSIMLFHQGIYRLEDDGELTLCLNVNSTVAPKSFELDAEGQQMLVRLRRPIGSTEPE